ncbi:MAG TPA: glutamate-5-semialdehyde dehydrogenase [Stellaceae bacterium]|nr:glutamate-5-semialdehyde dehydrogenase [Stellaceae bacterium]
MTGLELEREMQALGVRARAAAQKLARVPAAAKTAALKAAAAAIRADEPKILAANARDLVAAGNELSAALRDRLALDGKRVAAMAQGLEEVADLPDPIGTVLERWTRPNGLDIARVRIPLGVIGIIYESRPNVTADAGGLCLRAGNAVILRGGSESFHSSTAIAGSLRRAIASCGLPEDAVQLVPTRDRAAVGHMLTMTDTIDVIVPRGGRSLIERVQRESRIPVIAHLEGICHVYVDGAADLETARRIVFNAKMRRTGICGAAETLLVDKSVAKTHLPPILADLHEARCEIRGDEAVRALDPAAGSATEADWTTEYLDAILSVRVVDGLQGAVEHINRYGSHHTDAIVTADKESAERFLAEVDSAIVLVNASTQFADGGEFGMGAEIGISTNRLPPRGPVGAEQLTTYKYVVRGNGQVRP